MAHTNTIPVSFDRFGLKALYTRFVDLHAERVARRRVYDRTLAELQAYSDRDLVDLGLGRSELLRIAKEAAGLV